MPGKPKLRYDEAIKLHYRLDQLFQELQAFTDAEEDAVEDGADSDPAYIDALAKACLLLDEANEVMNSTAE